MKTPKEKARDLYDIMDVVYFMNLKSMDKSSKELPISMYDYQIKECALAAVEEILYEENGFISNGLQYAYWVEVQNELKKL